jgi:hypothetical protein
MKVSLVQSTNGKKFIKLESPDLEIESKNIRNNEDDNFYFFTNELSELFPLYPSENPNPYGNYEDDID